MVCVDGLFGWFVWMVCLDGVFGSESKALQAGGVSNQRRYQLMAVLTEASGVVHCHAMRHVGCGG